MKPSYMTEAELIQAIRAGKKPYCLLTISRLRFEDVYLPHLTSGGIVELFLDKDDPENPFDFPVFCTTPTSSGEQFYYRTAIPVNEHRERI